jgi:hypothetical protein
MITVTDVAAVNCRSTRTRRLPAASVAVVAVSAAAAIGAGYAAAPAGAAAIPGHQAPGQHGERCVVALPQAPARAGTNWSAEAASPPTSAPAPSQPAVSGGESVSVTIPPTVFIRVGRKHLFVTTNTGVPPVPSDEFWVLTPGNASLADASIEAEVLAGCTSPAPKHGSSPPGPPRTIGRSVTNRPNPHPAPAHARPAKSAALAADQPTGRT